MYLLAIIGLIFGGFIIYILNKDDSEKVKDENNLEEKYNNIVEDDYLAMIAAGLMIEDE